MSIIKSNNAGLDTSFNKEWLREKGLFDISLPVIECSTSYRNNGGKIAKKLVFVTKHYSIWEFFGCEQIDHIFTVNKRLYNHFFPAKVLKTKKDVLTWLDSIMLCKKEYFVSRAQKKHNIPSCL